MVWTVEKRNEVTAAIRIDWKINRDWEQWGLLVADQHLDNPHTQVKLYKKHLAEAVLKEAFVISVGDMFDAMQGKQDRRSNKSDLIAELKEGTYLNKLVDYAAEVHEPYVKNLAVIGEGNHETSITNRYEYSLLDGLIYKLKTMGSPVVRGGYRGWIQFLFDNDGNKRQSRNLFYLHGSGGGGPVTKGVIQTNRRAVYLPDADYVVSGHIHEQWVLKLPQVRLSAQGVETQRTQYHVQLPSYKEEFVNCPGGWHQETGKPPKPIGAWWMRFYNDCDNQIQCQFIEAV
jgi:hypothetical protein